MNNLIKLAEKFERKLASEVYDEYGERVKKELLHEYESNATDAFHALKRASENLDKYKELCPDLSGKSLDIINKRILNIATIIEALDKL